MNLRTLCWLLGLVGLLFVARPGGAQPAEPAKGQGEDVAILFDALQQDVDVLRKNNAGVKEKLVAQQEMADLYALAAARFKGQPEMEPVLQAVGVLYHESASRAQDYSAQQGREVERVGKTIDRAEQGISSGRIKVANSEIEQVALKKIKDQWVVERDVSNTSAKESLARKNVATTAVGADIAKVASDVVAKALLIAKPYLPKGVLAEGEVADGYYLFINQDSAEHGGILHVRFPTKNGSVNGFPELDQPITVGPGAIIPINLKFRRTGTGTITSASNFEQTK